MFFGQIIFIIGIFVVLAKIYKEMIKLIGAMIGVLFDPVMVAGFFFPHKNAASIYHELILNF